MQANTYQNITSFTSYSSTFLDYKDLGQWEKLAYSIPVDFNGNRLPH